MKYAAFFRNLNLGRPNCPNRAQLEAAFISAGADTATSFLTNGTVVFVAGSNARAAKILSLARQTLQAECGLTEPAYIRSVDYLAELVALDPFAVVDREQVYECCVSFLHADSSITPASLPLESKRRDLEIFRCTSSEALSVSKKIGNSPGSPNAFLEKLLGLPATTRSWNTVLRLVRKHG
ncbi:DUF1697 domain-containing protein [Collimonas sp. OK242]|jgi:uncharacterized protein (DUF1697 family)|uniref:DUF1697 domain-containing protein n=1 Tax=Collimonas sp. OK242 TaxID=1798195 RepID=UPI000B89153A|nr:DUF1697 domain-containing protein [Collimonas sp. OK242]